MMKNIHIRGTNSLNNGCVLLNIKAESITVNKKWKYLSRMRPTTGMWTWNLHFTHSNRKSAQKLPHELRKRRYCLDMDLLSVVNDMAASHSEIYSPPCKSQPQQRSTSSQLKREPPTQHKMTRNSWRMRDTTSNWGTRSSRDVDSREHEWKTTPSKVWHSEMMEYHSQRIDEALSS
jgi:hypothetical protein